jgi:hypothetical protein
LRRNTLQTGKALKEERENSFGCVAKQLRQPFLSFKIEIITKKKGPFMAKLLVIGKTSFLGHDTIRDDESRLSEKNRF